MQGGYDPSNINKAAKIIDYYYAIPLAMIPALYELLDSKTKQSKIPECKNSPDEKQ
jgi:hypothetical protein